MQLRQPTESRQKNRYRGREGFTLVEVACAACVLAFAICSSLVALQSGFRTIENARDTTLASQLLQSQMEDLRLNSWSDMVALRDVEADGLPKGITKVKVADLLPDDEAIQSKLGFLETRNYDLTIQVTEVEVGAGATNEMVEVMLRLNWTGLDGTDRQRSVRTYYARDGLYDYYYTAAGPL